MSKPSTILIIEDEALAADRLVKMIQLLAPDAQIVATLESVEEAIEWFNNNPQPNLIISDIRLSDGLSFEIFKKVSIQAPVIFTTAYDQYAIKAFEVNSVDYLLKPIQKEKLEKALQKIEKSSTPEIRQPEYQEILRLLQQQSGNYKSRFMVRLGQKIVAVPIEKIAYFFSESKLSYIVTIDNKKLVFDQTLEQIEQQIDPRHFFRANRQYLIRFESITEIHPYFKGRVKLKLQPECKEEVIVSSERSPEFKRWVDQ